MPAPGQLDELRRLPLAIDRSWDRTPLARFAAAGCVGVLGYLSWDPSKNWTRALIEECHAAGMWVGLNWEGRGDWNEFVSGAAGGAQAGRAAANQCAQLGAPDWVPIFVSADYDTQSSQYRTIAAWLDAFEVQSGHPVGIYGDADLIDAMLDGGHATVAWQTNAYGWSAGRISDRAALVQFYGDANLGASVDENRVRDATPFAWYSHGKPPSAPQKEVEDMTPDELRKIISDTVPGAVAAALRTEGVSGAAGAAKEAAAEAKAAVLLATAINNTVNGAKK